MSTFSNRAFHHVEFGAGLKSNNFWKIDRCLLFSFANLVTEVILALSKCRKKANQNSGILPSLVDVEYTVKIFSVTVLVHNYGTFTQILKNAFGVERQKVKLHVDENIWLFALWIFISD